MATTKRKKTTATKKSAPKAQSNVVRIKAKDTPKTTAATTAKTKTTKVKKDKKKVPVLSAISGYFVGAWRELRQVHWPNRRSTWGLTMAVILYTLFFVALILLLDSIFRYLFDIILGK